MTNQKTQVDGKDVTVVRDAHAGDPGFDPKIGSQKIVSDAAGKVTTVLATAVKLIA